MLQAFPLCPTAGQEASRSHRSVVDRSQVELPSLTSVALAHRRHLVEEVAPHTQASPAVHSILVAVANMALVAYHSLAWLHKRAGLGHRAAHAVIQAWAHEASCWGVPWHLLVNHLVAPLWRATLVWKEHLGRGGWGGFAIDFAQAVECCRPLPLGERHWEAAHQTQPALGWTI